MTTGAIAMPNSNFKNSDNNDRADKALRWIGDLDHPFYDDERQRYVWYESASIGFQLLLLGQYTVAAVAMIIGGIGALPIVAAIMVPVLLSVIAVQWWSRKHNAPYMVSRVDWNRRRGQLAFALMVLYMLGLARVVYDAGTAETTGGFAGGFSQGAAAGGAVALVVVVVLSLRDRARQGSATHELD